MKDQSAQALVRPLAVNAIDAAAISGISRSMWFKQFAAGRTPQPIKIGRRTLWRVADIEAWIAGGCTTVKSGGR